MLRDRDFLIFFLLLFGVILIRVIPLPSTLRTVLFFMLVIAQGLFVYNGIRRGR